jgi:hypothetical protein
MSLKRKTIIQEGLLGRKERESFLFLEQYNRLGRKRCYQVPFPACWQGSEQLDIKKSQLRNENSPGNRKMWNPHYQPRHV